MKFELYHHFHMILVENEEITADIKPLASFKHSVKYWWTKPKSQSEEVCYYHFWELINDQWYFLSVFFFFLPSVQLKWKWVLEAIILGVI